MVETLKSSAPHIRNATVFDDLVDWGAQPDMVEGQSHSSGRLLFKGPNNQPETGIWVCTPGRWRLSIPRDEFCHFVAGRATYTADDGEVIEVELEQGDHGRLKYDLKILAKNGRVRELELDAKTGATLKLEDD